MKASIQTTGRLAGLLSGLLLAIPAGAANPTLGDNPDCVAAKAGLEKFLDALPRKCRRDSNCEGSFFRVESCSPAVVHMKMNVTGEREKELVRLQDAVRTDCKAELASKGPCSPTPYRAACVKSSCVDTLNSAASDAPPARSAPGPSSGP